ncbi:Serine--tRNA ligase [Trichinella pseudospiralis]
MQLLFTYTDGNYGWKIKVCEFNRQALPNLVENSCDQLNGLLTEKDATLLHALLPQKNATAIERSFDRKNCRLPVFNFQHP